MVALLDVNLLIALAWPNHVHHEVASKWYRRNHSRGWATCPLTQNGFVRVSSNHRVMPEARSPQEARLLLQKIVALANHAFWVDDTSVADSEFIDATRLVGYRQVTDAHLLALALRKQGRLATLDGGIRELVPDGFSAAHAVCLVGTD